MQRKILKSSFTWVKLLQQAHNVVPEAFDSGGNPLNFFDGNWIGSGHSKNFVTSLDCSLITAFPMIDLNTAKRAVHASHLQSKDWARVDLDERRARVSRCVDSLRQHRELLAGLLVWEIGKPFHLALNDVDRCVTGVEWYVENIEGMLQGRQPIGLVSNIASWNYPYSVLMHAALVQMLAGNAVIAKTPSDGGLVALTVGCALASRAELPFSLVSGSGGQLSDALVRNEDVACLAFVGGKTNGGVIAASLFDQHKRYMLEMEGVNAYGVWDFSDWQLLAEQIKKGYEYGKQRCTAYARFVIQRDLFPKFLSVYTDVLQSLRYGHPLLVEKEEDPLPKYDFGPLINSKKVEEIQVRYSEAKGKGGVSIYEGVFNETMFLPGQDISAYSPPLSILNVPRNSEIYHSEPFGPLDTIVIVDRLEELVAEMNVSNGCLVASLATDKPQLAAEIIPQLRAFKTGVNRLRSRGDNAEAFGGKGQSWKGCFVGGEYLVQAVTMEQKGQSLFGNFPNYVQFPPT